MNDTISQPAYLDLEEYEFIDYLPHLVMNLRLGFESREQAEEYEDCIYALVAAEISENVYACLKAINTVGKILWSTDVDARFVKDRVSRRDFLNFTIYAFLARLISVNDILLYLLNHVCEMRLSRRQCNLFKIRQIGVSDRVSDAFGNLQQAQEELRNERNDRFHLGFERSLTSDDQTYRMASDAELNGIKLYMLDNGEKVDIDVIFLEAKLEAQALYRNTLEKTSPILSEALLAIWECFDKKLEEKRLRQIKPLPWIPA